MHRSRLPACPLLILLRTTRPAPPACARAAVIEAIQRVRTLSPRGEGRITFVR